MKQFIEASAGTGKTYQIMEILADLINEQATRDIESKTFQNILSKTLILTFTDKAAGELMERLRLKIEDLYFNSLKSSATEQLSKIYARYMEEWEEVTATTMHGFCFQVLSEFPVETDSYPGAKMAEVADFIESEFSLILQSEWEGNYKDDLFKLLKDSEFFKVKKGKEKVNATVGFLLKPKYDAWEPISGNVPEVDRFLQETSLLLRDRIFKRLEESNLLTYDSMIRKVKIGVETSPKLRSALMNRYDICLLDEFQDTDSVQFSIFKTLFSEENKSLYCIGDPKQSIYGFRGGDLGIYFQAKKDLLQMPGFKEKEPLLVNYRSLPNLIEAYNKVFQIPEPNNIFPIMEPGTQGITYTPVKAPEPKDITLKTLVSTPPLHIVSLGEKSDGKGLNVDLAVFNWNEFIANEIKRIIAEPITYEKKEGDAFVSKTVSYKDIAILVLGKKDGEILEEKLRAEGIPCSYYKRAGIYESEEATQLTAIMHSIQNSEDPREFKRLLYTELFGIHSQDLKQFDEYSVESKEKILIDQWRRLIRENQIPELFRRLEEDSKIFLSDSKPDLLWERRRTNYRQILRKLLEHWNKTKCSFSEIIVELNRLRNQKRKEEEQPLFDKETERDTVQILTIHVSKGLEWPIVFFHHLRSYTNNFPAFEFLDSDPGMTNLGDSNSRRWNLNLWKEGKGEHKSGAIRETQRLFYVALTRPKLRLYLPYWSKSFHSSYFKFILETPLTKIQNEHQNQNNSWFLFRSVNDSTEIAKENKTHNPRQTEPSPNFAETLVYNQADLSPENYLVSSYSKLSKKTSISPVPTNSSNTEDSETPDPDQESQDNLDLEKDIAYPDLKSSASMGEFFHSILEHVPFSHFNQKIEILQEDPFTRQLLEFQKEDKYLRIPKEKEQEFYRQSLVLLQNAIQAQIPLVQNQSISLLQIDKKNKASESEFYLRFTKEPEGTKGALLTGKVDLIFEANGFYYIVDYKSNLLASHTYENSKTLSLVAAEKFSMQKEIYSMALYDYLKARLGEIAALEKFGGVLYLFLRGMKSGKSSGVYFDDSIFLEKDIQKKKQIFEDSREFVYREMEKKFKQAKHFRKLEEMNYQTFGEFVNP